MTNAQGHDRRRQSAELECVDGRFFQLVLTVLTLRLLSDEYSDVSDRHVSMSRSAMYRILFACMLLLAAERGSFAASEISLNSDIASGWGNNSWLKSMKYGYRDYGHRIVSRRDGHPVRFGNQSIRFEVRPGDCGNDDEWNDCANDRERHELSQIGDLQESGDEYWFAWSIYIPADTPSVSPTITGLGQFHQKNNNVLFLFKWNELGYVIDNQSPGDGSTKEMKPLVALHDTMGRWIDILVHARWSDGDDGFLIAYADHRKVYEFNGPTIAKGDRSFYKFGIYRSWISRYRQAKNAPDVPAQTVYFDEVHRGTSLKDVDRAGLAELQKIASEKGYYAGSIDGVWGPNTLQAANRLLADKNVGPVDRYSMEIWDGLNKPTIPPQRQPEFAGHFIALKNALAKGDPDLVREWQTYLLSIGLYRGEADGQYSPHLRDALIQCMVSGSCKFGS